MTEETKAVMDMLLISPKLQAWCAGASTGEELRANIDNRIIEDAIVAEYSTGVDGALCLVITDLLALLFCKVDWNAVLKTAKQQVGQLIIA